MRSQVFNRKVNPLDQFAERGPRELPLGTHLAIVALSRALRPLLNRSNRFVAAIAVPPNANMYSYRTAAHWLLTNPRAESFLRHDIDVIVVKESSDLIGVDELTKINASGKAVVLFACEDWMNDDVRLLCDLTAVLHPPTARDIKIAAVRMGFGRIKDRDAEFLERQDITRLSLVMRQGRSVDAMMARLLRHPVKQDNPQAVQAESGPTLHDLHGLGAAKQWGLDLATDLADWKAGTLPWSQVDRGLLLSGPPGCGKTSYAAALAKTCGVNLVLASAARWQARGHLGDLLKAMRRAFDDAIKNSPSIIFIDEFDSFPDRKSLEGESGSYSRQVVNGLLECLDGANGREGVVVVGATNFPELIDEALLRPGRLERHCAIPLPDVTARAGIFRYHLGDELESSNLDLPAGRSNRWTGADIERCVRDAKRLARRARRPMMMADLVSVMPARTRLPSDVLWSVAVHEVGHAIVGVLAEADQLLSISIEDSLDSRAPVSALGGAVFQERPISRKTSTYFENKIAVLLAGMAAERIILGDHSTGSAGHREADLNIATDLATMMEIMWGFGNRVSSEVCDTPDSLATMRLYRPGLVEAVESTLKTQMAHAERLLESRREVLLLLAETLLAKGQLGASEIVLAIKPALEKAANVGFRCPEIPAVTRSPSSDRV